MAIELAANQYGKGRVRLVKVMRHAERHQMKELAIDIWLTGDFETAFTEGDNRRVLPTDTMKNTVYALAADHALDTLEAFGMTLAQHFLDRVPEVQQVQIDLSEELWHGVPVQEEEGVYRPHPHAFYRSGPEHRTCTIRQDRQTLRITSGLRDLHLLKTKDSGFADFRRDDLTTLRDTNDRLLGTDLTATWQYTHVDLAFTDAYGTIRQALLDTFARHESRSVQHTLYAMGHAALEASADISEIYIAMPNKHRIPVDLRPLGRENCNAIFVSVDEPYGFIEATLRREN